MITWAITNREVSPGKLVVICQGADREAAKREARPMLGGDPDLYICTPLNRFSDTVVIKLKIEGERNAFAKHPGG